ncbi:MAG: VPLPA-CTERM sorting domain-containing protein [Rhodobacteraceae bacterium]|jgi:hypothetical protein|nr:VPLPA-CTERM sorting domain-containing protein [Paracoccaceae bacterium]
MRLSAAVVAALLATASVASAATISFNVNSNWTTGDRTFTSNGNSVSVEAFTYGNAAGQGGGTVALASWSGADGGLGICSDLQSNSSNTNSSGRCRESHQVDGSGRNELAVLDFGSRVVQLTSVTFARAYSTGQRGGDLFDLFVFGNGLGAGATQSFFDRPINCGNSGCTVNVASLMASGSVFGLGAFADASAFKIQAVSFADVPPSVIPLPAAGWGLIAGLGALAALKRRRKAA